MSPKILLQGSDPFAFLLSLALTYPLVIDPFYVLTIGPYLWHYETFEKRSILFKAKEGENFNHRNTLSILRIKI